MSSKTFKNKKLGLELEYGKFATQANGAAWLKHGNNIVLSTAVASEEERDFMGFFPLTIEYRERTSAAGKIPSGFIKREGRLSDIEVLTSRMIDRPIRPLFPKFYFNEVQIISSAYSSDGKFPLSILGLIGSSLAITLSKIPFLGPIGAVLVSRTDGKWMFNDNHDAVVTSDVRIIVAGTKDGICMVEGHCDNLSEKELAEVLFLAHEQIKEQVEWQISIQKELGIEKDEVTSSFDWEGWQKKVSAVLPENVYELLCGDSKPERSVGLKQVKDTVFGRFTADVESGAISKTCMNYLFEQALKDVLPDAIAKNKKRIDGRAFDQVRPITSEVGLLPMVHGSAMFRRGETQALASVTLGTAQDAQKYESVEGGEGARKFMLHYNFPPFSTGEARPMRGVGRREIGHGYLAEKSFSHVIPSQEEFPYTLRSVVDILESNGSSSMASVCSTTLGLMDAGVPIKAMVGGTAMGLIQDTSGNFHIMTDILGFEDAFGLMDFKITGTKDGIMGVQMDIKAKAGLTKDLLEKALEQAREARLHIIDEMSKALDTPRPELSEFAPRIISFKIDPEKIGGVIGPAGKIIKEIIASTGTEIDIDDDGTVRVYSKDSQAAEKAREWINILTGDIKVGAEFYGTIKKIADFGLFVELVPGKEGLIHISAIDRDKHQDIGTKYNVGDKLNITVMAVDQETGRIRLVSPELKKNI